MPAILNFYTPQRHIPLICLKLRENDFFTIATSEVEHWRPGKLGVSSHIIAAKFLCSDCEKSLDRYDVISSGGFFFFWRNSIGISYSSIKAGDTPIFYFLGVYILSILSIIASTYCTGMQKMQISPFPGEVARLIR